MVLTQNRVERVLPKQSSNRLFGKRESTRDQEIEIELLGLAAFSAVFTVRWPSNNTSGPGLVPGQRRLPEPLRRRNPF